MIFAFLSVLQTTMSTPSVYNGILWRESHCDFCQRNALLEFADCSINCCRRCVRAFERLVKVHEIVVQMYPEYETMFWSELDGVKKTTFTVNDAYRLVQLEAELAKYLD